MKRKLTDKLRAEIKANPYRLRQGDFAGDALVYLHRVRGARKAVKTKAAKAKYKAPKKKSEKAKPGVQELISAIARQHGMSVKQLKKKYPSEISLYEAKGTVTHGRRMELLINDIRFAPRGTSFKINNRKVSRARAALYITRLMRSMLRYDVIYPEIHVEFMFDGKNNFMFVLPSFGELAEYHDSRESVREMIEYILENYEIKVWWKPY